MPVFWEKISIMTVMVVTLSGCNLQYKLLYHPDPFVPSRDQLAESGLQFWPGKEGYRGFIGIGGTAPVKGTVIVFHGNAGTAADRVYYVKTLGALGYRVILAEYPAYGARTGGLGEKPFVNDARETVRIAFEKYGGPVYFAGESLGCGIAAAAVGGGAVKIDGIILITPWDTLVSVAKSKFRPFPVGLFMKDKYDTIENLKGFTGRMAVIGAERDEIIPVNHAEHLFESLSGSKKMWTIGGAGHNDWQIAVDLKWWERVMNFISGKNP